MMPGSDKNITGMQGNLFKFGLRWACDFHELGKQARHAASEIVVVLSRDQAGTPPPRRPARLGVGLIADVDFLSSLTWNARHCDQVNQKQLQMPSPGLSFP